MAKFRKSLHFGELESSESDREENLVCEDRDLSPPAPKKQRHRQSKPPAKLREYDTDGSNIDNIPEELCKCISVQFYGCYFNFKLVEFRLHHDSSIH